MGPVSSQGSNDWAWLPSANGLLCASTYLWLSAPFLQPLYLRSGVAGSQVLSWVFGRFWRFGSVGLGLSRSSPPRISCERVLRRALGESFDVPLAVSAGESFDVPLAVSFSFLRFGFPV